MNWYQLNHFIHVHTYSIRLTTALLSSEIMKNDDKSERLSLGMIQRPRPYRTGTKNMKPSLSNK